MIRKTPSHFLCLPGWKHLQPSSPPGCSFSLFGFDDVAKPEDHSNCKSCGSWSRAPAGAVPSQTQASSRVSHSFGSSPSEQHPAEIHPGMDLPCAVSARGTQASKPQQLRASPTLLSPVLFSSPQVQVPGSQPAELSGSLFPLPTLLSLLLFYSCPLHTKTGFLQLVPVPCFQAVRKADHREDVPHTFYFILGRGGQSTILHIPPHHPQHGGCLNLRVFLLEGRKVQGGLARPLPSWLELSPCPFPGASMAPACVNQQLCSASPHPITAGIYISTNEQSAQKRDTSWCPPWKGTGTRMLGTLSLPRPLHPASWAVLPPLTSCSCCQG